MEFIVEKIGMSRVLDVPAVPVTLVRILEAKVCEVTDNVAIIAYNSGKKFNKTIEGQQKKYNLSKEFNRFKTVEVSPDNKDLETLDFSVLVTGAVVKTTFTSKGRGFAGVVKRWNFAGGRASHGHRMGRTTGSIGNAEWPGRVQRGKKMPGHYGCDTVSVKNEIVSYDSESNILALKGSIAGANGSLGKIKVSK
jgi:large subunit ribosomal protein L3